MNMESSRPNLNKNQEIEVFIAEYKQEESLWNAVKSSYKDRNERESHQNHQDSFSCSSCCPILR